MRVYCLYTFMDKEDRNFKMFFNIMKNGMQTDLRLKIIQNSTFHKNGIQ